MQPASEQAHVREGRRPQTAPGKGKVSYLDQALWTQFQSSESPAQSATGWLTLQCAMLRGVLRGSVVLRKENEYQPVAEWPSGVTIPQALYQVAEVAIRERKGVVRQTTPEQGSDGAETILLSYPILIDDQVYSVVSLELEKLSDTQTRAVMRQLQWGASWFEALYRRSIPQALEAVNLRQTQTLNLLATQLTQKKFVASCSAIATELASQHGCERVSIGFLKGSHHKLAGVSHSSEFDKRTNLVALIGDAMDEAADQSATVVYPPIDSKDRCISRAQRLLAKATDVKTVCSVPLWSKDKIIGALTFEHKSDRYFTREKVNDLKQAALLLGPLFARHKVEDRWIGVKVGHSIRRGLGMLLGAGHLTLKLVALLLVLGVAYLATATGTHRVAADASLEGWVQRHVTSPIDGFVEQSFAQAGDVVSEGDPLFSLDSRQLELEKEKWSNQIIQLNRKYRDAFVRHDKPQAAIFSAQLQQARAELELVEEKLARTTARSPFDGVVVAGDLSQKLGAPVEKGESLYQVAPLDAYRIVLAVDEWDVSHLQVGQEGELTLFALAETSLPFVVTKITPVASTEEGLNTFKVEGRLNEISDNLRPGMQGTGKVAVDEKNLFWIWTHRLFDRLRVWFWTLGG